ncbi:MAG: hypothetical protein LWY06_01290 [Firmicutes bacterium]|nr:hypothetical protein [Bacillota bacterium]
MAQKNDELSILQNLSSALEHKCPKCGFNNEREAELCAGCGVTISSMERDPSISITQNEGVLESTLSKVSLEDADNLKLLKKTVDLAGEGEIGIDEYRANVSKILAVARAGVELVQSESFLKQFRELGTEYTELAGKTGKLYQDMLNGCRKMMEYDGGEDGTPALEGLEMVEESLARMDELQDELAVLFNKLDDEPDDDEEDE